MGTLHKNHYCLKIFSNSHSHLLVGSIFESNISFVGFHHHWSENSNRDENWTLCSGFLQVNITEHQARIQPEYAPKTVLFPLGVRYARKKKQKISNVVVVGSDFATVKVINCIPEPIRHNDIKVWVGRIQLQWATHLLHLHLIYTCVPLVYGDESPVAGILGEEWPCAM